MYIKFNETKITILAETHDDNVLTLHINPDFGMTETYDLFSQNDLDTITLYKDDDRMMAVYARYKTIESFFFVPLEKKYVLNLSKYKVGDLQEDLKQYMNQVDKLTENFAQLQSGNLARQSEYALQAVAFTFTDEQALNCILLFPEWDGNGVSYKKDDRVRYENKLYRVLQDHTSQADWIPGSAASLFVEISDPSIEYPEWKQPTGAHDAYTKGDKITFKGKKYISLIEANVYSPEEYPEGWDLIEK